MEESLSQRLRIARAELSLTQTQAAKAIGVSQPMLHRAETSMQVSTNKLLKIIDYYVNQRQINPAWLLRTANAGFSVVCAEPGGSTLSDQEKLSLLQEFRQNLDKLDKPTEP